MMRGVRFAALAVAVAAMVGGNAFAALHWYDGFEIDDSDPGSSTKYVTGPLHGQDGGTGTYFTGTWESGSDPDGTANYIEAGSLTAPGQNPASTGGKVSDGPPVFGGCCHMARSSRLYSESTGGVDGTVWMTFLANWGTGADASDPQFRMVEWWNGGMGDGFLSMQLGYQAFPYAPGDPLKTALQLRVTGVDTPFGTAVTHVVDLGEDFYEKAGGTRAVAIKFEFSTLDVELGLGSGDTVSVYLDPTGPGEPTTPDAVVSGIDLHIDRMGAMSLFHFQGGQTQPGAFDELRVGDTWADVALTTPEPASLCLLALAAGCVLVSRRTRSA